MTEHAEAKYSLPQVTCEFVSKILFKDSAGFRLTASDIRTRGKRMIRNMKKSFGMILIQFPNFLAVVRFPFTLYIDTNCLLSSLTQVASMSFTANVR